VQLPEKLLQALDKIKGFDRQAFEKVHSSGEQIISIRINPVKKFEFRDLNFEFSPVPWTQYGFYLTKRPSFTFDPLFHAGCYYVQEASSMFLEQAFKQTVDLAQPVRVLDLSAAPGGKSTHIQSLISADSLLVSNDVIRSRANILKDNIIKWGCKNVVVTNNDPRDFAKLEGYFDVIVIDAPCSGSGLFRREPGAIDEWSENNVALCSQRQQRIIADVFPALKNGGMLIYSTCSYSKDEDEDIVTWLLQSLPVAYCPLAIDERWNVVESDNGYRFWPDKVKGEGFFIACFRKTGGEDRWDSKVRKRTVAVTRKETELIEKWMDANNWHLIKNESTVYAWPASLSDDMNMILSSLKVIYSGVRIGELMNDKLIPDHSMALSNLVPDSMDSIELNYEQAILYLQRKEIGIEAPKKGWHLVKYRGHALGWVNVLPNRINNYYPKEFRILKEIKSPPQ
jgi:16S rRNA C967 or C1407 C5-methylase (RsmB/RsmF family)/NOL1/NOP2/fmu family ribosome biogenesis protein